MDETSNNTFGPIKVITQTWYNHIKTVDSKSLPGARDKTKNDRFSNNATNQHKKEPLDPKIRERVEVSQRVKFVDIILQCKSGRLLNTIYDKLKDIMWRMIPNLNEQYYGQNKIIYLLLNPVPFSDKFNGISNQIGNMYTYLYVKVPEVTNAKWINLKPKIQYKL